MAHRPEIRDGGSARILKAFASNPRESEARFPRIYLFLCQAQRSMEMEAL